ncbi:ABC transporter substrate-binding protein [Rouxiella badensis]|jgi:polar amino acid transport system substrate-binding protein|uniref:ABC transporter substrate-binding protein n=1 Tax=Rouxiella badensis TaxID=1646377 RepID=UPI000361029A|nr:ABC transporter substrate-binding protein [Rouxiella badensis]MCC3705038.1 ABC transporter substrate-binding protein [Rouxiella badensis]MCC3721079.1 ABC transporter substrate-binding protein [Rouxiella badensis]MCC3730830.1 ABC transporter substrate-binding protein [Rouxiella badensis]MCC3735296.1 ABC transporter substrate-binding protein [Rouxiella badensis]MCC3742644.1 ABC transporter substrate-binding protein [Rouxiella badensis]
MPKKTFLRRYATVSLAALCLSLPLLSQAATPSLVTPGQLTYGTAATFMPFEFTQNGQLTGFDIDLITALSKKLALKPAPMSMEFKGLIPALQGKRLDIINSAMYINPTRAQQVDFVPYLKIGSRVIVAKGNPEKITGRDLSLCGKNIAVTLGGIEESQARADNQKCLDAKKSAINVLTFPAATDSAVAVAQKRADAEYLSTPGAVALLSEKGDTFETTGPEFEAETHIGFAVRKGDTEMKTLLETGLNDLVADGSYQKLINKWQFPASVSIF